MGNIGRAWKGHLYGNRNDREPNHYSILSVIRIVFVTKFSVFRSPSKKIAHTIATAPVTEDKAKMISSGRPSRSYDNKVQSLGAREPRQAWGEGNQSDELVTQ
jgi:hypothetical protein